MRLLAILVGGAFLATACPAGNRASGEYAVKAAFLANFVKFIEWPSGSANGSSIVIGVVGKDPFGKHLDDLVGGKSVDARKIVVRRLDWSSADEANLVFVPSSENPSQETLSKLSARRIVVVGETAGFAAKGGTIGFILQNGRVGFEINVGSARTAGVTISSKLLQLARIVGK